MTIMWNDAIFTGSICCLSMSSAPTTSTSSFSYYKSGPDHIPIVRYIQSHYKTVTLPILAERFSLFCTLISPRSSKKTRAKNFTQLIKTLKMKEALEYLEKTDLSIEEISEKTG